jgi:hypothetical protein
LDIEVRRLFCISIGNRLIALRAAFAIMTHSCIRGRLVRQALNSSARQVPLDLDDYRLHLAFVTEGTFAQMHLAAAQRDVVRAAGSHKV